MIESVIGERLRALGLTALAEEALRQRQDPTLAPLTFEERLGLCVDAEWMAQQNRQLARRLQKPSITERRGNGVPPRCGNWPKACGWGNIKPSSSPAPPAWAKPLSSVPSGMPPGGANAICHYFG